MATDTVTTAIQLGDMFPYMMGLLGFLAVYILNGIRAEVREVKDSLKSLEHDLRGGVGNLDRRVTVIETRCGIENCGDKK